MPYKNYEIAQELFNSEDILTVRIVSRIHSFILETMYSYSPENLFDVKKFFDLVVISFRELLIKDIDYRKNSAIYMSKYNFYAKISDDGSYSYKIGLIDNFIKNFEDSDFDDIFEFDLEYALRIICGAFNEINFRYITEGNGVFDFNDFDTWISGFLLK